MRAIPIALILAACTTAPPAPDVQPTGGRPATPTAARALSCDSAVAVDAKAGERAWVDENYPGAKITGETRTDCGGKPADAVTITTADGRSRTLYFLRS